MSFANKKRDSKDTAKLRSEYEAKAEKLRTGDFNNATERDKAKSEKIAAFQKMQGNIIGERRENLSDMHKVLIQQGKLKTPEQVKAERAKAAAGK